MHVQNKKYRVKLINGVFGTLNCYVVTAVEKCVFFSLSLYPGEASETDR